MLIDGWFMPVYFFYDKFMPEVRTISKELRVNDEIRAREIRLIGVDGEQLGVMHPKDALKIAQERDLDLVEIAPNGKPAVCRIMDYGKYKYEQSKRERENKKNQKVITIKEVKLRPNIEDHDFYTKVRNAAKFLESGSKVKVTIMFRGREITHAENGKELCNRVAEELVDICKVEKPAKVEGRNMTMMLTPTK
jgi:translation initiation factor IF-3